MKKYLPTASVITLLSLSAMVLLAVLGCNTSQQKTAYNTLFSLEQTTTAAVDAYDALVVQGKVPTNDIPKVSKAYNDFQAGMALALDAVRNNTNAVAPPNLVLESQDLVNLLVLIENTK